MKSGVPKAIHGLAGEELKVANLNPQTSCESP